MNNLSGFLSVFENLLKSEEGSKVVIKETLEEILGFQIESSKITLSEFRMYVDAHPVIKNEILLKKEEILEKLSRKTGKTFDSIN